MSFKLHELAYTCSQPPLDWLLDWLNNDAGHGFSYTLWYFKLLSCLTSAIEGLYVYIAIIPSSFSNVTERPGASVLLEHQFVKTGMYICMYICMRVCMYVYMYVCMYICVYVCM